MGGSVDREMASQDDENANKKALTAFIYLSFYPFGRRTFLEGLYENILQRPVMQPSSEPFRPTPARRHNDRICLDCCAHRSRSGSHTDRLGCGTRSDLHHD